MIEALARNQNWAKAAPALGLGSALALLIFLRPSDPLFWALVNIPLYLFHQTEEHLWPGGFKSYMNGVVYVGRGEPLTDRKIFWINIILVWFAFAVFGALSFVDVGFGLVLVVFSLINCLTHIVEALRRRRWNPGLVMASVQFLLSLYAAWFLSVRGVAAPLPWWIGSLLFAALSHALLFGVVMGRRSRL